MTVLTAFPTVNTLDLFLLLTLLAVAVYSLYVVIRLRRTRELFPSRFLYPGNCEPEDCIDPDGFIDYILPRLTLLSSMFFVMTLAFCGKLYAFPESGSLLTELPTLFLPVGVFLWYCVVLNKSSKNFW